MSALNAGDLGSIPGSERFPGEGNGNSFQYPCLENSMGRGDWWAIVHLGYSHKESDTTEQLTHTHIFFILRLTLFKDVFDVGHFKSLCCFCVTF